MGEEKSVLRGGASEVAAGSEASEKLKAFDSAVDEGVRAVLHRAHDGYSGYITGALFNELKAQLAPDVDFYAYLDAQADLEERGEKVDPAYAGFRKQYQEYKSRTYDSYQKNRRQIVSTGEALKAAGAQCFEEHSELLPPLPSVAYELVLNRLEEFEERIVYGGLDVVMGNSSAKYDLEDVVRAEEILITLQDGRHGSEGEYLPTHEWAQRQIAQGKDSSGVIAETLEELQDAMARVDAKLHPQFNLLNYEANSLEDLKALPGVALNILAHVYQDPAYKTHGCDFGRYFYDRAVGVRTEYENARVGRRFAIYDRQGADYTMRLDSKRLSLEEAMRLSPVGLLKRKVFNLANVDGSFQRWLAKNPEAPADSAEK